MIRSGKWTLGLAVAALVIAANAAPSRATCTDGVMDTTIYKCIPEGSSLGGDSASGLLFTPDSQNQPAAGDPHFAAVAGAAGYLGFLMTRDDGRIPPHTFAAHPARSRVRVMALLAHASLEGTLPADARAVVARGTARAVDYLALSGVDSVRVQVWSGPKLVRSRTVAGGKVAAHSGSWPTGFSVGAGAGGGIAYTWWLPPVEPGVKLAGSKARASDRIVLTVAATGDSLMPVMFAAAGYDSVRVWRLGRRPASALPHGVTRTAAR